MQDLTQPVVCRPGERSNFNAVACHRSRGRALFCASDRDNGKTIAGLGMGCVQATTATKYCSFLNTDHAKVLLAVLRCVGSMRRGRSHILSQYGSTTRGPEVLMETHDKLARDEREDVCTAAYDRLR